VEAISVVDRIRRTSPPNVAKVGVMTTAKMAEIPTEHWPRAFDGPGAASSG